MILFVIIAIGIFIYTIFAKEWLIESIKGLDEYSANYYKKFIFGNDKVEEVFNPEGDNLQSINNKLDLGNNFLI